MLPHRQLVQARGLLWASDGVANGEILRRCDVDSDTVRRWRFRFAEEGADGVGRIPKGHGRKPSLPAGIVEEVLRRTREERPADGSTHWSNDPRFEDKLVDLKPFIWKATAEDIIAKVQRGRATLQ